MPTLLLKVRGFHPILIYDTALSTLPENNIKKYSLPKLSMIRIRDLTKEVECNPDIAWIVLLC